MTVVPPNEAIIEARAPDVEKAEPKSITAEAIELRENPFTDNSAASTNVARSPSSSSQHTAHTLSTIRQIALVVIVTGAAFLNTLGIQAVVILLPNIGHELSIPVARQQWIVSAYSLTFGCFLLLFGRLADIFGKRRVYLAGSAWLTVITIIIPFVKNEIAFDLFRGLQGLGAAANVPTAIGILGITFPPGKAKNYAFAFYGGGAPMGAIFGNILGGVLGTYIDWQWVFWILSIFAATNTVASYFVIPPQPSQPRLQGSKRNVDWIGGFLITAGLLVLLFALTEGNVVGWSTPWVPVLIGLSIVLIIAFVIWQDVLERKTDRAPLMKVSIFASMQFSAAIITMFLFFAAFNNYLIFATYYYQLYQGLSVIQTTLRFIPNGVVGTCLIVVMAHIMSRVRGNYILIFSLLSVGVSNTLMAVPIPPSTTYWAYGFPAMIFCVCGADTLFPTLSLFVSMSLPLEDQALGGGLINAVGQMGRAVGLAVATAIQVAVTAHQKHETVAEVGTAEPKVHDSALLSGLRAAFWFNFATSTTALVVVLFAFRRAGVIGKR
ncbi:MFS general substrate transporter [Rhizodiscina lignyota]|uniref:MFS general substrate transporter n=1 Tax=Rhizodiscina lignyota TaxID=1504668 RepID=A0A9P4IIP4_9PEZI|nr:MFS general substrate transporter [Rhizodiscina lignyota]